VLSTFTFVIQLGEASSVTQQQGRNLADACQAWLNNLDRGNVTILSHEELNELRDELRDDEPVSLTGLTNAWYVNAIVKSGHVQIHIVKTDLARDAQSLVQRAEEPGGQAL